MRLPVSRLASRFDYLRGKSKRGRKRAPRQSLLEVLEQRALFTASPSTTTPYWQTIMPNQLPDGGQLIKQNSPVLITIDDGLATNNYSKNPIQPIYDSRTAGHETMTVDVPIPDPDDLLIPDPDYPCDGESPYLPPPPNYTFGIDMTISDGTSTAEASGSYFVDDDGYGTKTLSLVFDTSGLPTGRYNISGEIAFPEVDLDTPISGVVNVVNRTDNPSTGAYHSEFGSGWSLPGLDRLYIQAGSSLQPAGVAVVTGDNQYTWFGANGDGSFHRADGPYDFSTLTEDTDTGTYTLADPDGTIRYFDANGMETSVVDHNGNTVDTFTYTNADGAAFADDISTITDNVDRVTTFNYAGGSLVVTSITDFAGRVTTLTHDSYDRLTSIAEPDPDNSGPESGPVTQYAYNGTTSYMSAVTDPRGLLTQISYDDVYDVYQITDPNNNVIEIDSIPSQWLDLYDGDVSERRDVYGNVSYATRDDFYNVLTLDDADGNSWIYTYDDGGEAPTGVLESVTAPNGLVTQYQIDHGTGQLNEVINSDSSTETFSYTTGGLIESDYESVGSSIRYTYSSPDANGNIEDFYQYDSGPNPDTHYTYTDSSIDVASDNPSVPIPSGLVKTITDPNGSETAYSYNSHGLVSSVTSGVGTLSQTTTTYEYDTNDNLSAVIDGLGNETDYVYDNLNRLVQVTTPAPTTGASRPVTKYTYDADGNLIQETDPLGIVTQYVYDSLNRQVQVIQPVADPDATPFTSTASASSSTTSGGGTWTTSTPSGKYSSSVKTSGADGGTATFTISSSSLDPTKKYMVEVRWVPSTSTNYSSDAQWQVYGNTSSAPLATQTVDLNLAPQGVADGSDLMWISLGAFTPYVSGSTHSLTVKLSDVNDDGLITVDAVRLVEVGPVTQYGYDASGNKTSVTDPNGNTTSYAYDYLNRLTQETDPTVGATTPITTHNYNAVGFLTSTTDPTDLTTTFFYDRLGRQIGEVQPGEPNGLLAQYYLPGGSVISLPDFTSLTPDHTRQDSNINFASTSSNFGGFSDLDNNFAVQWTGAIKITTGGSYDFNLTSTGGGAQLIIDGQTLIDTSASDATVTLSAGWHSIQVQYFNHSGNSEMELKYAVHGGTLAAVPSSVLSPIWQTGYDGVGRKISSTDPLGNVTTYAVNPLDEETSTTDANGNTTYYTYDLNGNQTSETDSDENTTTWVYNGLNQVIQDTDQLGNSDYYSYDANGNLVRKIDKDGRVTRYTYDALNRETNEIWQAELVAPEVLGRYVFYYGSSFDHIGPVHNITTEDNAIDTNKVALLPGDEVSSANITNYSDGITGIMVDIASLSTTSLTSSDFSFKVGTSSDPSTWSTLSTAPTITVNSGDGVDGSDRVTLTWANGTIVNEWLQVTVKATTDTGLANDDVFYFGNLIGDVNGSQSVTTSGTNNDATLVSDNYASGVSVTNPYDLNRDGYVDSTDVGIVSSNSGHSLTSFTSAPVTIIRNFVYTYNDDNWLTAVTDDDAEENTLSADYTYTYDNLGHVTSSTVVNANLDIPITLTQGFDDNGNRLSLAAEVGDVPDDFVNTYSYDALNQMTEIIRQSYSVYDPSSTSVVQTSHVDFSYNADGQFNTISRYQASDDTYLIATSAYSYDAAGHVSNLVYNHGETELVSFELEYDADNRLSTKTISHDSVVDETNNYGYDNVGQLTDSILSYDANGNPNQTTNAGATTTIGANNQILSDGTYNYTYDREGNLISKTFIGTDYGTYYQYDFRNRLISAVLGDPEDIWPPAETFAYDAFNRLVAKGTPTGDTAYAAFVYDGTQVVLWYYVAGYTDGSKLSYFNETGRFLWGPGVDMLLASEVVDPYDVDHASWNMYWGLVDEQNTDSALVQSDSSTDITVDGYCEPDAFGNFSISGLGVISSAPTQFVYTGRYFDQDIGLQWNGNRWYDPNLGRFMTQDPLGLLPGTNPYDYVNNDPTNEIDPSGLWGISNGQKPGRPPNFTVQMLQAIAETEPSPPLSQVAPQWFISQGPKPVVLSMDNDSWNAPLLFYGTAMLLAFPILLNPSPPPVPPPTETPLPEPPPDIPLDDIEGPPSDSPTGLGRFYAPPWHPYTGMN